MSKDTAKTDQEVFQNLLPELLEDHEGKFALIHAGALAGVFDTMDAAYEHAVNEFGVDRVYIGRVRAEPDTHQSPALYHGTIHARL